MAWLIVPRLLDENTSLQSDENSKNGALVGHPGGLSPGPDDGKADVAIGVKVGVETEDVAAYNNKRLAGCVI